MKLSHAVWGHPRRSGHGGEVWWNLVHWRREWQTISAFLLWEPHEWTIWADHNSVPFHLIFLTELTKKGVFLKNVIYVNHLEVLFFWKLFTGGCTHNIRGPMYPSLSFPKWLKFLLNLVQCPNQEIDTVCLYSPMAFYHLRRFLSPYCNQNTELYHSHKDAPLCHLLKITCTSFLPLNI